MTLKDQEELETVEDIFFTTLLQGRKPRDVKTHNVLEEITGCKL